MGMDADRDAPDRETSGLAELLKIGTFARRSRISQRAPRIYERRGLLAPATVDEVALGAGKVGALVQPVGEQDLQPRQALVEGPEARGVVPVKVGLVEGVHPGLTPESQAVAAHGHERQDLVGEVGGMVERDLHRGRTQFHAFGGRHRQRHERSGPRSRA